MDSGELPEAQNWATRKVIRFLVGAGPACFFVVAMFCVYKYPITKEYHHELVKKIEEKKKLGMHNEPGSVRVLRTRSSEARAEARGEVGGGVKLNFDRASNEML